MELVETPVFAVFGAEIYALKGDHVIRLEMMEPWKYP